MIGIVLYSILAIYLFFAIIIFYSMINNIFWIRSKQYELDFDKVDIKKYYLQNPKIRYYLIRPLENETGKWVILFHSWGRNAARMRERGKIYLQRGYSLVMFDAPGHGESQWVPVITGIDNAKYAHQICSNHDIENPVAHGLSFGAISAVLFAQHQDVTAVLAEALFSNFKDMYDGFFGALKLPKILYGWIPWIILKLGPDWSYYEPKNLLPSTNYPIFLIHGENDEMFHPKLHWQVNLEALGDRSNVFSWIVPNSPHSKMAQYPNYEARINEFLDFVETDPKIVER